MEIVAHSFEPRDLAAGHPALDFVNTVTARDTPVPLDWLDSYERLLEWAALARVTQASDLVQLRKLAAASARRSADALARVRRFREALHSVFSALIAGRAIPTGPAHDVESAWKKAIGRTTLSRARTGMEPALAVALSGLDYIVDRLALSAVDLLRHFPAERARLCRGEACGWFFVDTSKGGRRIWCDMATCGNVAKSRRHRERIRTEGEW